MRRTLGRCSSWISWRADCKDSTGLVLKMRIAVYNLAAHEGGALFVLKNFYQNVLSDEHSIEWLFLTQISIDGCKENVRIKKFDCSTSFKRAYADLVLVPKELKAFKPDVVISLQNTAIWGTNVPQYVYMHQSLQYCPYRFSLFKSEERNTAIRQIFICGSYKNGLKKAKHIFVQTKWIQEATAKWTNRSLKDITVVPVTVDDSLDVRWKGDSELIFFYPARAEMYKNHQILIDACKKLGDLEYRLVLTVDQQENSYASMLAEAAKGLPIDFIGTISRDQVFGLYEKSVLVFPSYLETCGLPLLEAANTGSPIIAADLPYAHEALDGYSNVSYFRYDSADELAEKMKSVALQRGQMRKKVKEGNLVEEMLKCINS